jgi:hypothetical protein
MKNQKILFMIAKDLQIRVWLVNNRLQHPPGKCYDSERLRNPAPATHPLGEQLEGRTGRIGMFPGHSAAVIKSSDGVLDFLAKILEGKKIFWMSSGLYERKQRVS